MTIAGGWPYGPTPWADVPCATSPRSPRPTRYCVASAAHCTQWRYGRTSVHRRQVLAEIRRLLIRMAEDPTWGADLPNPGRRHVIERMVPIVEEVIGSSS